MNKYLLTTLSVLVGVMLGVAGAEFKYSNTSARTRNVEAQLKESKSLAEKCHAALEATLETEDKLYKVTNLLIDIVWDWSCSEILELKATPKPTLEGSPGEVSVQ